MPCSCMKLFLLFGGFLVLLDLGGEARLIGPDTKMEKEAQT